MSKFNVAAINCCTEAEGPFKRLAIWFQGCDMFCKGCCNPDYQPLTLKHLMTAEDLIDIVKDARDQCGIEGVTYSGGEPTLQTHLNELTRKIQEMGLGVISFTGHLYETVAEQLEGCDVVIDGKFEWNNPDKERKLIGSKNQRIIFLTERYRSVQNWFLQDGKILEINVGSELFANGDNL